MLPNEKDQDQNISYYCLFYAVSIFLAVFHINSPPCLQWWQWLEWLNLLSQIQCHRCTVVCVKLNMRWRNSSVGMWVLHEERNYHKSFTRTIRQPVGNLSYCYLPRGLNYFNSSAPVLCLLNYFHLQHRTLLLSTLLKISTQEVSFILYL